MALAGLALPVDLGSLAAAFSVGLLWRPAPPPVHLHCPAGGAQAEQSVAPSGRSVPEILLAFAVGVACGRLWSALAAHLRPGFRRPRALFER